MLNLTDEQLVTLYISGEKKALDILIKRYLTVIFNFVYGYVKDESIADDITQEVFVKVWKKIKKFDNRYKFKSWLFTIAKNTSLDYLKKKKIVNFTELDSANGNLLFENLIAEVLASPQTEMERAEDARLMDMAVDKLPKEYRQTIKLRYYGGYKFREIAEILKQSIETVKSRNRRALIYLKRLLKTK